MPIIERKCVCCDSSFFRKLSDRELGLNKGQYCSTKCHYLHKQKVVACICLYCATSFVCHPATIRAGGGKYCSQSCRGRDKSGEKSASYKGGTYINSQGYVAYSKKDGRKSVLQHRFFVEQSIGRPLLAHEVVHHKNGIKTDNRLENLELETVFTHHLQHALGRWAKHYDQCNRCSTNIVPHQAKGLCIKCFKADWYQSNKLRSPSP